MSMKEIDMNRIREALPKHAKVYLKKKQTQKGNVLYLECFIRFPDLGKMYPMTYEEVFEEIKEWQRHIIGKENISEFYTEETGNHWLVYLNRVPMTFINTTDEDIKTYTGFTVEQLAKKPTL